MRWLVTLLAVSIGCKAADREEPPPVVVTDEPKRATADAAPQRTVDLPPDLEGLAEMPELTAEATEAEINRRVDRVLDAFTAFVDLIAEHRDCAEMGRALSRFAAVHQQFFANLQKLGRPELQKKLGERLMERGTEWITRMGENLQRCATHPEVTRALAELSRQQR